MWNYFARAQPNQNSGDNGFPEMPFDAASSSAPFNNYYRCYSVSFAGKSELEKGNKILLPPSALLQLARLQVSWPMLFELSNENRKTHCGVLEFVAEEGCCNLPYWMMQNLCAGEGTFIRVVNTSLPKGTYVKLQPVTSDFLEISNPKAVLEHSLRHFAALTVGDCIALKYNDQPYEIEIIETRPARAISVIETDVDVDFAPPKDYVEPPRPISSGSIKDNSAAHAEKAEVSESSSEDERQPRFNIFGGVGMRVDGRPEQPAGVHVSSPHITIDETPWKQSIPHGVRTSNKRYSDLVAKGAIKVYSTNYKRTRSTDLFKGPGRTAT